MADVSSELATSMEAQQVISRNPATGDAFAQYPAATPAEVRAAISVCRAAQQKWAREPIAARLAVLRRFQKLLADRKEYVATMITAETGKPIVEALATEILLVLDAVRFGAENVRRVLADEAVSHGMLALKTKRGRIVNLPIGVVGIIAPWNYPFSTPGVDGVSALALGNGVVLKPSEFTTRTAFELQTMLLESGLPAGLFQVIAGFGETGAALISGGVDKIIFTGSVPTGKRVAAACAEQLVPCTLELGGKDAMLVLEDADVDVASSAAVWGSMMNAGQTCISVERCLVHESLYQRFVDMCVDKVRQLRVGNGAEPGTDVGPLISARQLEIVEQQVTIAVGGGAHAVIGGHRLPDLGSQFYAPTVMTNVNRNTALWCEETFGPVLPIVPFKSDDEAISVANHSEFGLAASVWTKDLRRGESVARRLNAGAVLVNDLLTQFATSEAPHGGSKASGIGRTHGIHGMQAMVVPKYIGVEHSPIGKQFWWYKYGAEVREQMSGFIDMLFSKSAGLRAKGAMKAAGMLRRKRL